MTESGHKSDTSLCEYSLELNDWISLIFRLSIQIKVNQAFPKLLPFEDLV